MRFDKLPIQIQRQVEKLTVDEEFQQRFSNDSVLDQLDALKYDPFLEYNELQLILHNNITIRGKKLNPITLALWSFLYIIKSPLIFTDKKCTCVDIDLFFYLLETKDYSESIESILKRSANFCIDRMKITYEQADEILQKLIKVQFRVLNMFPKYCSDDFEPVFNVDWLTSIATKVAQVSNYSIAVIYNQISVCEAFYLFAQYCRQKGSESIFLRTEEEIMEQEDLRATTLVVERLIELKVIDEKDKQFYINTIHFQENN